MGHSIHISDIKLEGVEFVLASDAPIVSVLVPRKVVEEVAAPVTEELKEPEVITEKKREEEEEPEEGEKKKKPAAEQPKEKEAKK
jgi:hypothetical protein